jgi:hypothetical protein
VDARPDSPDIPTEHTTPPPIAAEPDTCYHRCLPLLLQNLQQETGEKQLAEILELSSGQLKKWLKRAIEEKKIIKKTKKRRNVYIAVSAAAEQTLFDSDGDAA